MTVRNSLPCMAATLGLLLIAAAAGAAPTVVENDPAAMTPEVVKVRELWRAGGEDDEVFFGTVGAVRTGPDGEIYLMDSQLSEVHVFAADGTLLRTVGGEGDGPGEVRQPGDMFVDSDGTLCLLQSFPGRVVKIHPDGTPAGETAYSSGADTQGQFAVLNRGLPLPDGMVLVGIRMSFGGTAVSEQTYFMDVCDAEGARTAALFEKNHTIDYSDFALDEGAMDFVWTRVAAGPDGLAYAAPERNAYEVQVFDSGAEHVRTIRCAHEPLARDEEQRKIAHQIVEAVGAYYPTPPTRITTEDTEAVIAGMWATSDGRLWVQSSRSEVDLPEGTWLALDVFGPDGKLQRRFALPGDHDPRQDVVTVLDGGRVVVVTDALAAFLNQQAVGQDEAGADEGDPLEVFCYQIEK